MPRSVSMLNTMKKIIFFFGLLFAISCTNAQSFTPPSNIPPYRILTTDSVYVTPANLKKDKPVMIVYFSPDCGHCQHLMHEIKTKISDFKNMQVVMITFVEQMRAIKDFSAVYKLADYPNFTLGTEGYTYLVQQFYQVRTTPYIALYDKKHKLTKFYDKAPPIDELAETVKKL